MATPDSVFLLFGRLSQPEAQTNRVVTLVRMPRVHLSGKTTYERQGEIVDWALAPGGCGLEELSRVLEKLIDEQGPGGDADGHGPPNHRPLLRWRPPIVVGIALIAVAIFAVWRVIRAPLPQPFISISNLGDEVAETVTVTGKARAVPPDQKIWLVVKSLDGRLYPQSDPADVSKPDKEGWQAWEYDNTCVGPRIDWGQQFEIEAVLANQNAQQELKKKVGPNPCQTPISQLPGGATIYAREKITRKLSP